MRGVREARSGRAAAPRGVRDAGRPEGRAGLPRAVGQTKGFQDVEIRARVEGFLETVDFREGSFVRKGELLYTIDREAARGDARRRQGGPGDRARRGSRRRTTTSTATRRSSAKQAVSQQELDNARAAQDAARSQVEAAKAAVEKATLDLGYTRVTSPIDGLVGTTQVKAGNLVGRGESTLLTTDLADRSDPLPRRRHRGRLPAHHQARSGARAGKDAAAPPASSSTLADGTVHPQHGQARRDRARGRTRRPARSACSSSSRTPSIVLRPGPVRPRARPDRDEGGRAARAAARRAGAAEPATAWRSSAADNKVAFRNVKVGPRVDTLWVIEKGLKPGEQVVVEGLQAIATA